ncbi:ubiquitin carboxyl-terminal hydrolase [Acrasis kona]|uniref:ubiquitinyl hydrolase 1 n=1 Tax=Acrasis kona TaxID=1008807 RepID=A0AAW2YXA5_9EUKA
MPTINSPVSNQHNENVIKIVEMGFTKDQAIDALKNCNDDVERSIEWIFKNSLDDELDDLPSPPPLDDLTEDNTVFSSNRNVNMNDVDDFDSIKTSSSPIGDFSFPIASNNDPIPLPYNNGPVLYGADTNSKFEDDLTKAIEASLREKSIYDVEPVIPIERLRTDQTIPVGLKNIGNTCYVNSLVQTYFFIPRFRKLILEFKTENIKSESIRQLQRLFAHLVLSERKYVDPSSLVNAMNNEGVRIKIGDQEDVGEFNDQFLTKLEEVIVKNNNEETNVVKDFFYGQGVDVYDSTEDDGTSVQVVTQNEFCNLIVNVSDAITDLYSSLDAYTSQETVDFTTEKSFKTKAVKSTWFKRLPPNLIIQLQRTCYDEKNKSASKILTPLTFPEKLYVDRYLEENKAVTLSKRAHVSQLTSEISSLQEKLNNYRNWQGTPVGIEKMLTGTILYLNQHSESLEKDRLQQIVDVLNQAQEDVKKATQSLEERIVQLKNEADHYFDDLDKREYSLHSILVHDGNANSGHYWAYMRVGEEWYKFNDMNVTLISKDEVMKVSSGKAESSACAYCLIYVEESLQNLTDAEYWKNMPSQELSFEVQRDNDLLQRQIFEYEQELNQRRYEEVQQFTFNFEQRIREIENIARSPSNTYQFNISDHEYECIRSFPQYLYAIDQINAAHFYVADQVHMKMFNHSIYHFDHEQPDQVGRHNDLMRSIQLDRVHPLADPLKIQLERSYDEFIAATRIYESALSQLTQQDFLRAYQQLLVALYMDQRIDKKLSRDELIRTLLAITICQSFVQMLQQILKYPQQIIADLKILTFAVSTCWDVSEWVDQFLEINLIQTLHKFLSNHQSLLVSELNKEHYDQVFLIESELKNTPHYKLLHDSLNHITRKKLKKDMLMIKLSGRPQHDEFMRSRHLVYGSESNQKLPSQLAYAIKSGLNQLCQQWRSHFSYVSNTTRYRYDDDDGGVDDLEYRDDDDDEAMMSDDLEIVNGQVVLSDDDDGDEQQQLRQDMEQIGVVDDVSAAEPQRSDSEGDGARVKKQQQVGPTTRVVSPQ